MTVFYFEYSLHFIHFFVIFMNKLNFCWSNWLFIPSMGAFSTRTPASPRFFSFKKNFVFYVNALYFIMGKRTKRCPKKCEKHKFILKPIHYTAVFSRELEADYCSVNKKHPSIIPTFNNDKKHFTIGFFLPTDNVLKDIT